MEQHSALADAAEPFIGNTAATVAKDIINRAEGARHNKEACKYISTRVQESLRIIADAKYTSQNAIIDSQKSYENVLNEIKSYVIEIDKPGKFTEKTKEWLMKIANAKDIADANERLLEKLNLATNNFCGSERLDINNKVTEVQKTEGLAAIQIMIAQKGGVQMDQETLKNLQVDPSYFDDKDKDNDNDCNESQSKSIRKRIYCGDEVAVKKMPDIVVELQKIVEQAKIIGLLGRCNQIEKFYGTFVKDPYLFVVTEWMQNGNLQDYLADNESIQWPIKLKIAEQIARGLNFCSGVGVYHRDVRSKNVLLDGYLDAKLTNFEKSREVGAKSKEMPLDALRWTAPEKLEYPRQPYTDKCEVYSFSILLWEISAHKLPFSDIDNPIQASSKAKQGERPPFREDIPEQYRKYRKIIEQAWNHNPSKRPSIDTIRKQLRQMRNETKVTKLNRDFPEIEIALAETTVSDDSENVPSRVLSIDQIISLHKEKRYKEAFPQFLQLAKQKKDPLAFYYAGLYLYEGYGGIEKDEIRALQLLQKSADGGEAQGQYMYANACLKGSYYSPDEGLRYLKKAALVNNNPDALYMVSQFFLNGEHGYPVDNEKYMSYLTKAENKGSEKAKRDLAKLKGK